ncbi:MAG: TldD/PmbA family protein [Oscillatoriales cyanobacterium SM2_2_1]|nr:TldD/PmbA family protein [Oscillatoriales cyanobacterium SM2_2_1]
MSLISRSATKVSDLAPPQGSLEPVFLAVCEALMSQLGAEEHLTVNLVGERSQFSRFNRGRVRQSGLVMDGSLSLRYGRGDREVEASFPLTGDHPMDLAAARSHIAILRQEVEQALVNPFVVLPTAGPSSRAIFVGELLPTDGAIAQILDPVDDLDFVGFYAAGRVMRGSANSAGQRHWFETDSFYIDYSLYSGERAVKGSYGGDRWVQADYGQEIGRSRAQLETLMRPVRAVPRGQYRTYFAPAAAAELLGMLTGSVGEGRMRQGGSPLRSLWQKERSLSPLFSLTENFQLGYVPQFNGLGEISPEVLPIIKEGHLVQTLVSSRTAREYGLVSNGASGGESMRSPEISAGAIPESELLQALDTGLYLSNLHYLNWSDLPAGRITGMTRYACFWVEQGNLIAPIENLRFDHSLYQFLGDQLLGLTSHRAFIPDTNTYGNRAIGGILTPGILVQDFVFTL